MFDRLSLLLGIVCLLLSASIVMLWRATTAERMPIAPAEVTNATVDSEAALPVALTTPAAYSEMVERPLFVSGRRPPAESSPASSTPATNARFVLEGIANTPDNRVALLRDRATLQQHRVSAGGAVNGWELIKIDHNLVVMRLGKQRQQLYLREPESSDQPTSSNRSQAVVGLHTEGLQPGQWRR